MATKIKLKQIEDGTSGQLIAVGVTGVPAYVNQNTINLSGFNNDLGGSGLTVGTTTITGGTSTRVLYNNAGVVGEYAVTGTGSVLMTSTIGSTVQGYSASTTLLGNSTTGSGSNIVLGTSPVFGTDITAPIVYGSSVSGGNLTIQSTSNATKGTVFFGASASDQKHVFYVGTSTGQVQIRSLVGTLSQTAIYLGVAAGSETSLNYAFNWSGSLNINSQGTTSAIDFQHGSQSRMTLYGASTAGASPRWLINFPQQTNITASTETNDFLINTKSQTYLAGNQTILRGLYYKTQNIAFASGSNTVTTYYTAYFESGTASTNCAGITNNYSLGTAGKAKFGGNIELTQTVTAEALTSDTSVTIVINGTTYKLLAKA